MTLPYERKFAIDNTRELLYNLLDPKKTPRVPKSIRQEAGRCLKHYPSDYNIEEAQRLAPSVFGDWLQEESIRQQQDPSHNQSAFKGKA